MKQRDCDCLCTCVCVWREREREKEDVDGGSLWVCICIRISNHPTKRAGRQADEEGVGWRLKNKQVTCLLLLECVCYGLVYCMSMEYGVWVWICIHNVYDDHDDDDCRLPSQRNTKRKREGERGDPPLEINVCSFSCLILMYYFIPLSSTLTLMLQSTNTHTHTHTQTSIWYVWHMPTQTFLLPAYNAHLLLA